MTKNSKKDFKFEIIAKDNPSVSSGSKARVGRITTAHGVIETPSFVAVGTKASVKGLSPKDLQETGVQLLFGNTYHLHLRPGEDVIRKFGGLAKFMGWMVPARNASKLSCVAGGPTITDSGGFQVFSLGQKKIKILKADEEANLVSITEDGVEFRSHIDGSKHVFTPEKSIEIQKKLGADIILAFDECAPHPSGHAYTKEAMQRTHAWALRSLKASQGKQFYPWKQALYGIIQGGVYKDLREKSAKFISDLVLSEAEGFDGIAIGGVSVGESKKQMRDVLDWVSPTLPEEKPRHLLGIGEIDDIFTAIEHGMDTFDCVIPTRFGRYGIVFVSPPEGNMKNRFRLDINKTVYSKGKSPLSEDCLCYVCKTFTRGYVHHLFRANELLAYRLASYHNMFFINNIVKQIRAAILEGKFQNLKKDWLR